MQEEVEQRTITLAVNAVKFTGRELKNAIEKFMQHQSARKQSKTPPSVSIDDNDTRQFERIARKYHVQYKVFRCEMGKYQIFFKAPNDEAMQTAFREYVTKKLEKADRPSVLKQLKDLQAQLAVTLGEKIRHKEHER